MNKGVMFAVLIALGSSVLSTTASGADDDWFTINKNYFGQRYVDLDKITPQNVGNLKEVCEIQLNENSLFSPGLLKVRRTLYVTLSRLTLRHRRATCDLLCSMRSITKRRR
jgi:glucose dehydrogenase